MKTVLEVKGMTCGNCVKRVTKIISGISDVAVDLQMMEATFESDPRMTDASKVVQAINDFGYAASEKGTV
jgi:copper chaperone CopZ